MQLRWLSGGKIPLVILVFVILACAGAGLYLIYGPGGNAAAPASPPVQLTADEQHWIATHPTITVCPDPDYPPFEMYDASGTYAGIAADYLRLIHEKTGLAIADTRQQDWNTCLRMIRENRTDILGAVFVSDLRKGYLNYSEPFYEPPLVIITRKTVRPGLTLGTMNGSTVAVVDGYTTYELLKQRYPGIRLQVVPNIAAGLQEVSIGTADAYFGDIATASWYVDREGLTNLYIAGEYTPPDPRQFQLAIGVRNNEPELQGIIDKGLANITPAERQQVIGRWVSSSLRPSPIDPRVLQALLAGIACLLLVMVVIAVWNRSLRRAVGQKTRALSRELEERRRAEESLRVSEENYRRILETMQDTYYRADAGGNLVMLSRSGAALLGYDTVAELTGKNIARDLYADPADRTALLDAMQRDGFVHDYEIRFRQKNGNIITVSTNSHVLSGPDGSPAGVEGTFRDITRRKTDEEALLRKNEEVTVANEELTAIEQELTENYENLRRSRQALDLARNKLNVLNTITFQDLQTGIFTCNGFLQLAIDDACDGKQKEYLTKLMRIVGTMENSLRFAKQYQSLGIAPPGWQNVAQTFLLGISHTDNSPLARHTEVQDLEIYADPLLENVFFFLMENVLRHGRTATEVRLAYEIRGEELVLIFSDNGAGIPAAMKEKIFGHKNGENVGLGLFLSREILGVTGITIRENGVEGEGARFEMVVPKDGFRFTP